MARTRAAANTEKAAKAAAAAAAAATRINAAKVRGPVMAARLWVRDWTMMMCQPFWAVAAVVAVARLCRRRVIRPCTRRWRRSR